MAPRLTLLTTGGTIAGQAASAADTTGYTAGALDPAALLAAVPGLDALATLSCEPVFALDSKDVTPTHWLALLRTVRGHLTRADCDGVIITHGTDTLEETAFFLHLCLPPGKPVVFTAAMRPATALSADGPMNLYQAVAVAADPGAHGKGVLVVMNDAIFAGATVVKRHTRALDAIAAPDDGPIGRVLPVRFGAMPDLSSAGRVPADAVSALERLPRVDILYVAAGSDPDLLAAAADRHSAGVILALPGNGSLPAAWLDATRQASAAGIRVVRASRIPAGAVSGDAAQTIPGSGPLCATKARIALMLELATGTSCLFP